MEWLEQCEYTRQQERSGVRIRFLVFAFFALVWGVLAWLHGRSMYYVLQADAGTAVEGYVESCSPGYKCTHLRVSIDYQGDTYTVKNRGYHFNGRQREEAIATRRVTVYVNHSHPEESVMSLGVPSTVWCIQAFLVAVSVAFSGLALYQLRGARRGEVQDVES